MKLPGFGRNNKQPTTVDAVTDVQQREAVAEAGPGADEMDHIPTESATRSPTQSSHEPSDASQHDENEKKETLTKTMSQPDEILRSRGKVVLIMLSLCLAVFLAAIDVSPAYTSYLWLAMANLLARSQ